MKNLKLFTKALLMNVKFLFLNILKTTHNSVQERVKNALSRTLRRLVFKIFKKKNFTFIKSAFANNFRFLPNKCAHLLKTSNFEPQVPQNAALQQRYSPCWSKKFNFSGEIENNFIKNPNWGSKFFFRVVWSKMNLS